MKQTANSELPSSVIVDAQQLYREFHARCFWSYRPDLEITPRQVAWIRDGLRRHGGMAGWRAAQRLGGHGG